MTDTGYVTCLLSDSTITIREYDLAQTLLNTRSVTFTNIASVLPLYTSLSFVKYYGQVYADSQEWALRLGDQVVILQESVPGITVTQAIQSTNVLGAGGYPGSAIGAAIVYNGMLVVGGTFGRIGSYDGTAWKNYDGSGVGTGIYQDGSTNSVIGNNTILSFGIYSYNGQSFLVVGGGWGTLGSFNGNTWTNYSSGTGLCNNGTVTGAGDGINSLIQVASYLLICSNDGKIGSWNGSSFTNYNNGTAGAVCDNNTLLALSATYLLCAIGYIASDSDTTLVIASSDGKIASMRIVGGVSVKSPYTNVSTALYPTNNKTVIGAYSINAMIQAGSILVVGGAGISGDRIGSFLTTNTWYNYNSGLGYSDNETLITSSNPVTALGYYQNYLIVSGHGEVACFDPSGVKHPSGTGYPFTSFASPGPLGLGGSIRSFNIFSLSQTKTILFMAGTGVGTVAAVNSFNQAGKYSGFYLNNGILNANILDGFFSSGYLYVYRYIGFYNATYLINLVGNTLNKSYVLITSTNTIYQIKASNVLLQVYNGNARHIITAKNTTALPLYDGTGMKAAGYVGYTDFITLSYTAVYPTNIQAISGILSSNASWGYEDITYSLAGNPGNIYNYISQFVKNPKELFSIIQSNSNTLINAYGKLSNNIGVPSLKPFEFRVNIINEESSYFSVGLIDDFSTDTLGVIITNIGSINTAYQPDIHADDTILYQDDLGIFRIKKMSKSPILPLQKITDTAYKINTISPLNIVDTETNTLEIGSIDFNNRMLFSSQVAPTTSTKIASFIQGKYSNSIDTGDKLVTIVNPTSSNIQVIGFRLPVVSTDVGDYAVDMFIDDIYSFSTINSGGELVINSKTDTIYVASTFIPVAIGSNYNNGTVNVFGNTIFLKPNYDGYSIGNDIKGRFTVFNLFGQTYLFDGLYIYSATIDEVTGIFASKSVLAPAIGMQYIASSTTVIYFYSNFDNSIYSFTGGRSLEKFKRFNSMPKINMGIYSVVDNTVLFDTDTSFIWIRDSIISENLKVVDQTELKYYDTTEGLIIGNNVSNWQYTFEQKVGSTVVPLAVQTAFYGFNTNMKSVLSNWCITLYNSNKNAMTVKGTCYTIDEDVSREQTVIWNINPIDYNNGGYVRVRMQPQYQRTLGTSLKIETTEKILISAIYPEFKESENAVTTAARSR